MTVISVWGKGGGCWPARELLPFSCQQLLGAQRRREPFTQAPRVKNSAVKHFFFFSAETEACEKGDVFIFESVEQLRE